MRKFSVITFGCKLNQAEAEEWIEALNKKGYVFEKEWKKAELIIINSCTLTVKADSDVRKTIRKIKRENPSAFIIATGCLAERDSTQLEREGVSKVFSNQEKSLIVPFVLRHLPPEGPPARKPSHYRARYFLKIQEGCGFRCSYCIIPLVRGKARSEPLDKILEKVKKAVQEGFEEIVLTGIHIDSYGRDLGERRGLLKLLRSLESFYPEVRFRLSSLDPRFIDEELLNYLLNSPHIMPHYHISFQHVSERILRLMKRRGSAQQYAELISKIKEKNPLAGIGGDVIIGFPTEKEEDFLQLYEFVKSTPLTYLHVFSFSPRPETEAFSMRPAIPERIKKERSYKLRKLVQEKNLKFREFLKGKEIEATVIHPREALSENYVKVFLQEEKLPGRRIKVRVENVTEKGVEAKTTQLD